MQYYSTFENSTYLELAIASLEKIGIKNENIFAIPLDNRVQDRKLVDTLHNSDGTSMIDIGIAIATAFSVIGTSVGFILTWGPIIWGIISALIGFAIGLLIRMYTEKVYKKKKRLSKGKYSEVILIVACEETKGELVERILWGHLALGVAKV